MTDYSGYLICSDIDGTLVNSAGEISAKNLKAIRSFVDGGGLFTLATGRMPEHARTFPFLPNAPLIAVNGTVIYDIHKRRILREYPLDSFYKDVFSYIGKKYISGIENFEVYTPSGWVLEEERGVAEFYDVYENEKVYKYLFRFSCASEAFEARIDLEEKFGHRFLFDRSWHFGLEMHSPESGKGNCARVLKEEFCPDVHTVIAIGDYENDISLFKAADLSYATDNAPEHVKAEADKIAPSNNEDAVWYVINSINS